MITETLEAAFRRPIFQTQLLKVVFTTLYVDVKEPDGNHVPAVV